MTITDEMVERAAEAIHYAEYDRDSYPFENECDLQKRLLKQQARAALLAALGETHVVVPREPTEEMVKAAISAVDSPSYMVTRGCIDPDDLLTSWRAMLAAVPSPDGGGNNG